jgi:hypothetical protein
MLQSARLPLLLTTDNEKTVVGCRFSVVGNAAICEDEALADNLQRENVVGCRFSVVGNAAICEDEALADN